MFNLKLRIYDKKLDEMHYVDDLYYFEENYIHSFNDFQVHEIPMLFTGKHDINGAELWEGDKLTNNSAYGQIIYSEDHAAFKLKYLHVDNLITLKEAMRWGFYRIGNMYCSEH